MSQKSEFHNLDRPDDGLLRELAAGVTTRIFAGEHAMLSVVTIAPNAEGVPHDHPEEQWGVLLDGSAVRYQGGEAVEVKKGDFWRTPGGVPHTMRAGPDGARVLDIFAPPRADYIKPGRGFGG
jgi:quercetin dioxygenase-like cupin family protein